MYGDTTLGAPWTQKIQNRHTISTHSGCEFEVMSHTSNAQK